ncbi:MAG: DUF4258 domain-containing protein [Candidatus Thermoplasmatota archaeon]|nr:DUF4258 domain-containing protein [Candidatus Thermoplasmatota archaeon]
MAGMHSKRFARPVVVTLHARARMAERNISETMLLEVIDTGDTRYRDKNHLWACKSFPEHADNMLCAVLVLEDALVVKTVMHHFEIR